MARGRRTQYVRDASGRFASTPGGSGGLGAARKAKSPGAMRKKAEKQASLGTLQARSSLRRSRAKLASSEQPSSAQKGAVTRGSNTLKAAKKLAQKKLVSTQKSVISKPKSTSKKTQVERLPKKQPKQVPGQKQREQNTRNNLAATPKLKKQKSESTPLQKKARSSIKNEQRNTPKPLPQQDKKDSKRVASKSFKQKRVLNRGGILKGKAVEKATINKQLRREEARIRESNVENAVLINKRGRVSYRGTDNDPNKVNFGKQGKLYGYRLTATHNHPEAANPGYNPKVRGSNLTAGLSFADIKAGIKKTASEIRAVGKTRSYSYKPDLVYKKNVGLVANVKQNFEDELKHAFRMGTQTRYQAELKTEQKFQERIKKAQRQWWNPLARKKVSNLKKMQTRAMEALAATAHFQDQANAMRNLRSMGYNITARRNRPINTNSLTTKKSAKRKLF